MKTLYRYFALVLIGALFLPYISMAGNKDRSGQAGASELLINPWARSSGWGSANMAKVHGLEAMWGNVGGAAFTKGTQVQFSYTDWLKGTDTKIFGFGFTQRVNETGVIGLQIMSMSFGDIEITTTDSPDGGVGTYSPSLMNFAFSYSKAFSNSIYAGFLLKVIGEQMSDLSAYGIAVDIGIQYVTGPEDQFAFGVSLKNVGPTMQFTGDGLSLKAFIPGQETQFTLNQRSDKFELPAQLNIGAAYDFLFGKEMRLTAAGNFIANSFTKDQFAFGLEFSMKDWVMLRGGYTFEKGMWGNMEDPERNNVNSGLSLGMSVQVPINKEKGSFFAIDYAYRETTSFRGNHSFGVIMNF
jgi:hypothetical protein